MSTKSCINISESDFEVVAHAAFDAKRSGDEGAAAALDKIARKINAALSQERTKFLRPMFPRQPLTWQDVPSVFDTGGTDV